MSAFRPLEKIEMVARRAALTVFIPRTSVPRSSVGHPHRADPLAAQDLAQILLALGRARRPVEVIHEEHRVGEVSEGEARIALGELVMHDDRGERIHPGAAVLRRNGDAEEAELTEAAQERDVELGARVVLLGLRLDDVAGEVPHHLPEHPVLLGRVLEVERCVRVIRRGRHGPTI